MRRTIGLGALLWIALHCSVLWAQDAPAPDPATEETTDGTTTPASSKTTATGRMSESVMEIPKNRPAFLNRGGNSGNVRVSLLGYRRQIPNPQGIALQIEIANRSNQPMILSHLVDSLFFGLRNQREETLQLPGVPYELTRWRQGDEPQTPILSYHLVSLASNERALTDAELRQKMIVLEPMGHLTISLTVPRVNVIIPDEFEPMPPQFKKQEDGTPFMQPKTREDVLPPGIYTILPSINLSEDLSRPDNPHPQPRFSSYLFMAPREPEKRLTVDYTTPDAVTEVKK